MNKYVDIKYTVWRKYMFHEDTDMEKVAEVIKKDEHTYLDDLMDSVDGYMYSESQIETETYINPVDNEGYSTIEVYDDGKIIWENGIKQ